MRGTDFVFLVLVARFRAVAIAFKAILCLLCKSCVIIHIYGYYDSISLLADLYTHKTHTRAGFVFSYTPMGQNS